MVKDKEQAARRKLGGQNDYADARTLLAEEQTARIRQIRLKEEGELVEREEVKRFLVGTGQALNVRLRGIEKRFRSSFPGLDPKAYEFLVAAHEEALGMLSAEVLGQA